MFLLSSVRGWGKGEEVSEQVAGGVGFLLKIVSIRGRGRGVRGGKVEAQARGCLQGGRGGELNMLFSGRNSHQVSHSSESISTKFLYNLCFP